jgi:flagellar motor switch/type III secretory pathway protein FliN
MSCRAWLPDAALTLDRISAALSICLQEWAQAWIGDAVTAAHVQFSGAAQISTQTGRVHAAGSASSISSEGRQKRALLEALLGTSLHGHVLTERDHRLLDGLAGRALEDLVARCDRLVGATDLPAAAARAAIVTLRCPAGEIAKLELPHAALAGLVKASLADNHGKPMSISSRAEALEEATVEIEAVLGENIVRLEDIAGLAVGDILLLDRSLDEPAQIRIAQAGVVLGAGMLSREANRVALTIN